MFSTNNTSSSPTGYRAVAWVTVLVLLISTACTTSRYVIVPPQEVDFTDHVRVISLKDGSTVEFPQNSGVYDKGCECFRSTHAKDVSIPVDSVKTANVHRTETSSSAPILTLGVIATGLLFIILLPSMKSPISFEQPSQR